MISSPRAAKVAELIEVATLDETGGTDLSPDGVLMVHLFLSSGNCFSFNGEQEDAGKKASELRMVQRESAVQSGSENIEPIRAPYGTHS